MKKSDEIIVCRCEDITLQELHQAIQKGYTDFEELKRYLRVGMGPCQGRTCISIIRRELARYLNVSQDEINVPTKRPPIVNLLFETIEKYREKNH